MACADPLEAVLSAADKYNDQILYRSRILWRLGRATRSSQTPSPTKSAFSRSKRLANLYGHHPSFYGWYWPDEAEINPYYTPEFIHYVNDLSHEARQLKPQTQIMIAPYGTRIVTPDDKYVKQLDTLDVDIVAYQDEVGVRKSKTTETSAFYEGLRKAHDRSQKAKIWADVEIFEFESTVYNSALMPAFFDRVLRQLEAVSPWVDRILVYQYLGLMNKPGSSAFAGCPASTKLYSDYQNWLKSRS